jgi:IS30 family transposase
MNPTDMQHREFSLAERRAIELYRLGNWSLRRIARRIGRDHSAISREIRRNRGGDGRYAAEEAHRKALSRRRKPVPNRLDRDPELAAHVEAGIREGLSPARVCGRLRSAPPPGLAGKYVCHETVYRWLYWGGGRFGGLTQCLWTRRRQRRPKRAPDRKPREIAGRTPISLRPDASSPGHMETDSMVWHGSAGLLSVQVDRATLVTRLRWCPDRTAGETAHALRRCAETLPHGFVRSMAFDNGSEGAMHSVLTDEYGVPTFFCEPYSPWQKPFVENVNRTIRHWIPRKTKGQDLAALDWSEIERRLNSLPRKSLGYLTPDEALNQYLASGGATEI